jgi:hypothetical protein
MTNAQEEFLGALEALDYQRWPKFRPSSGRNIWYRRSGSEDEMYHVAYLAYQPRGKAYGLQLGFFSDGELCILERCHHTVLQQLHPNQPPPDFSMFILWMLFTLGSATDPRLLSIPDPLGRYTWQTQLASLQKNYLEPYFWPVKNARQARERLLTGQPPFGWTEGDPTLRAAQCLALAASDRSLDDRLFEHLLECRRFIPPASSTYITWKQRIESMFNEFRRLDS